MKELLQKIKTHKLASISIGIATVLVIASMFTLSASLTQTATAFVLFATLSILADRIKDLEAKLK